MFYESLNKKSFCTLNALNVLFYDDFVIGVNVIIYLCLAVFFFSHVWKYYNSVINWTSNWL